MRTLTGAVLVLALAIPAQAAGPTDQKADASCLAILSAKKVAGKDDWGPLVKVKAAKDTRAPGDIKSFVFGQYNMEDMIETLSPEAQKAGVSRLLYNPSEGDRQKSAPVLEKPEMKLAGVAATFLRADPDVAVVEEVTSLEALQYVNEKYLGSRYVVILIPGNDKRGINIGILVKRDLPFDFEVQSYRNMSHPVTGKPLFSRDLPVVTFREKNSAPDSPPVFVAMGTHYKSQRPEPGDPQSILARGDQVQGTIAIIKHYEERFGADLPIFLLGDYNREVGTASEFKALWAEGGMKDSFDMAPADHSVPPGQARYTEKYFNDDGQIFWSQLDSISGSRSVQALGLFTDAQILAYLDAKGQPMGWPMSVAEFEKVPSDHRMVRVVVDFQKLWKAFKERTGRNPACGKKTTGLSASPR